MVDWFMKGASNYDDSGYYMWLYLDHDGFAEGDYGSRIMEDHGAEYDGFMGFGVNTEPSTWTYGQQRVEIGLLKSHRIKFTATGVFKWIGPNQDDWVEIGIGGNLGDIGDVVIDGTPTDNEVLAWDTSSSKWINQTAVEAGLSDTAHRHDTHWMQFDRINSDGGAFQFNTTGAVTFNQRLIITESDDVDLVGVSGGLIIGGDGTGQHIAIDGNEIMSKLNATTVGNLNIQINGGTTIFGGSIDMNSNKITELTNGSATSDAMAFGQKYTNANALSAVGMSAARVFNGTISATGGGILYLAVGSYLDIKPSTDTYGIILRDSGSTDWMNLKNVNGISYIGDGQTDTANMIAINSTTVTFPGTVAMGANKITGLGNATTGTDALNRNTADGRYYTETEVNAFFMIGTANAKWIPMIFQLQEAGTVVALRHSSRTITNTGAENSSAWYEIPLPVKLGSKNLYIKNLRIGVQDADGANYVDNVSMVYINGYDSYTTILNDVDNKYLVDNYTYVVNTEIPDGVYKIEARISLVCATASQVDISYVSAECYYT